MKVKINTMRIRRSIYTVIGITFLLTACEQEVLGPLPDPSFTPGSPVADPSAGSADFTKFVAVGNSLTAGFQAGALFNDGQANSLPAIMNASFQQVGGGDFNSPDINSVHGFNSSFSNVTVSPPVILGRLILFDAGTGAGPLPTPVGAPGLPAPYDASVMSLADIPSAFTGDKAALNNFGVPGIQLGQLLTPATGTPGDLIENALYTRFASAPGTSTIIGDAVAAQGTFFMLWIGNNDVLGYAVSGGSNSSIFTDAATFDALYQQALGALTTDPDIKGVVLNIPEVTAIPFFTTVPWNAIPMTSQADVDATNSAYAAYNAGLDAVAMANPALQTEVDSRKINFALGANGIVIEDESLTDLSGSGLPSIRQTTADDLVPLTAATQLGMEEVPGNPATVIGVGVAAGDALILTATELQEIADRTTSFNASIQDAVDAVNAGGTRIALMNVNQRFNNLVAVPGFEDGVSVDATFAPPFGGFSEDGVHPNTRGYALIAKDVVRLINTTFGANVPLPNVANYPGTGLPVTP